jgi:DNA-binding response OmpR family regulator
MAGETILVIDDSEELLELLEKHILKRLGYQIQIAIDGRQGLEKAQQIEPDLIMLDMNMPRMSGMAVLDALRQNAISAPVIFMTGEGSEFVAVQAFRLGVFDYLTKPFSIIAVEEAVNRALHAIRLAKEAEQLSQTLITAEAVRQTVATLAHHINNQLMVANGGLELCQELLRESHPVDQKAALQILTNSQKSVRQIEAVLRVMNRLNRVELTTYHDTISMLDIETAVQTELNQMTVARQSVVE